MSARRHPGDIRIGVSSWTCAPGRGRRCPAKLPHAQELAHASRQFRSIEINGTFYGLQRPGSFARWAAATPADFVFAVKAPRFITHIKRLRDPEAPRASASTTGRGSFDNTDTLRAPDDAKRLQARVDARLQAIRSPA